MDKTESSKVLLTCPHLGLKADPHTMLAFASSGNYCFHCQASTTPSLTHQSEFCLSPYHIECPVYTRNANEAFPKQFKHAGKKYLPGQPPAWKWFLWVLGFLIVGAASWFGFGAISEKTASAQQPPPIASPTATPLKATETPIPATQTPTPVPPSETSSPTATQPPPQVHHLDVPVQVDGQKLLIHRVEDGEQLLLLARDFETSVEVIKLLNYQFPETVWTGSMIVIAPGMTVVDPSWPAFKAFEVTEDTTFEVVAEKLGVELALLKHYNRCFEVCNLDVGDWILIPYTN